MHKPLIALAVAATLGAFAAPVLAMTEGEYKAEVERLHESYSAQRVSCDALARGEKRDCLDKVRSQEKIARQELDDNYKSTGETRETVKASR